MKKILTILLLAALLGVGFYSCKTQEKRGLTEEQRERIDEDKEDFEEELEEEEEEEDKR
ncbi:MAG: hypothetical protein K9H65_05965 [Bacteroidales bacterium]|nr:hypothetical protein [Bacteroidales bacterium]